ncbi:WD40-repeat-containing domain protein [Biscogniauxia mediterranea]|nr:WD40-repeat-containing domain protein [Biscogniauxia mediterranea]
MSREPAAVGPLGREYVLNPITALAFFYSFITQRQYVLAGEDTDIKIYDVASSRFCGQLPVFRAQPIHGIAVPPQDAGQNLPQILAWGGHLVKVLPRELIEECIVSGQVSKESLANSAVEVRAPDWIFDGRVSPFDSSRVVLLTAHNEVIQAQVSPDRRSLTFGKIQSPSRPILYSGNFFWVSTACVLVAAGTVFGEILVWKCNLDPDACDPSCEVLFVFSGHEGSIFGVNISPEIQSPSGMPMRLLASCSDDRTVRIWDITERHNEDRNIQGGYGSQISDARETGFGDSVKAAEHDDSVTRCVAMAMGHISRIWQVEFAHIKGHGPTHNTIEVYSFGEDATAQKWHLNLGERLPSTAPTNGTTGTTTQLTANLIHQATFSNHSGKHIWSHAMTLSNDGNLLIATGGSDGKVALIEEASTNLSNEHRNSQTTPGQGLNKEGRMIELSLADVVASCQSHTPTRGTPDASDLAVPCKAITNTKESFLRYSFITNDRLFTITNSGRVFIGDFANNLRWVELAIPEDTRKAIMSYSVVTNSVASSMTFIGTTSGDIFCYRDRKDKSLCPVAKVHGKIHDIFCLSDGIKIQDQDGKGYDKPECDYSDILVTVLGSTEAKLLRVESDTSITSYTEISLQPGFIPTASAFCREYLVLGSRHGLISILGQDDNGNYSPTLNIKVKLKDAITSILPLPCRNEQPSPNYFLSSGRDGKFRIYEIKTTPNGVVEALLLHETSPPFGPMIEGSWFSANADGTRDLMLCGFRSKHFVVWNETRRQEVAAVECGGGHRNFAYASGAGGDPERVRFVFTKASAMRVFAQARSPHRTLKAGAHGREIKAVSAGGRLVATAAEDTVIRIWEQHQQNDSGGAGGGGAPLRCAAALEKHATGIQALRWCGAEHLFSSGGNEEFFAWRVRALGSSRRSSHSGGGDGLAVVCEAVFPDRSAAGDLRIMGFDVERIAENEDDGDGDGDGEGTARFCISMALSNSTLRCYAYSAARGFRLLGRRTYTGACLTQVRHLGPVGAGGRPRPRLLAAATDGHVAIYADMRGEGEEEGAREELPLVTRLHRNTVKALDMRAVRPGSGAAAGTSYLVVTGGDDNALGVMHIWAPPAPAPAAPGDPDPESERRGFQIRSKSVVRSAHAAAITGVAVARLEGEDAVVVTASNDQRVKVWRLVDWRRDLRVRLLDDRYSAVADAGDLEVLSGGGGGGGGGDGGDGEEKDVRVMVGGVGMEIWRLHVER